MTGSPQPAATPASELPDPAALNGWQLRGYACALCGARLHADRSLGTVKVSYGSEVTERVELWACRPACRTEAADRA